MYNIFILFLLPSSQRRPTQVNECQRRPMKAHSSQRRPTKANAGPRKPTVANDGQRRPTQAHEGPQWPLSSPMPTESRNIFVFNRFHTIELFFNCKLTFLFDVDLFLRYFVPVQQFEL